MYYIDNFALLILIYLLKSKQPIILRCYYDDFSEEELITYFDDVNNIIKENPDSENLVTSQKTNDGNVEISFINYSNLENYLKTYIEKYKNGDLREIGDKDTFERFSILQEELISLVENIKTNRKRYKSTNIKYAPIILSNYLINNQFIKDITIRTKNVDDFETIRIFNYLSNQLEEWSGKFNNWESNYFDCLYELDMDWYLNQYKKSKTKQVRKKTEYPEQQRKIYSEIVKCVNCGKYTIDEDTIRKVLDVDSYNSKGNDILNNAVSNLNKYYREINDINNKKVYLLKKQRNEYYYNISIDFTP